MDPGFRLSVDLGTCHTVAVVRRGDEPPRTLLFDGSPLLPSGVYAQGSEVHVGRDAERMSLLDPACFEPYPKRRVDEGDVLLGDREHPVVDLLAAVLRRVVAEARMAGVDAANSTVLTCPADWGPQRRAVLVAAAHAAGLGEVRLVDEPIAAATYCERVLGQQVAPGECLAVFDFGGGTLDVTVVRRDIDTLRVLAVGGLDDLGGVDIDAALVGHLGQLISLQAPDVWRRLSNPDSTVEMRDRRTFWAEIRGAKEMLSRTAAAPVQVPGSPQALHLTRDELDRVAGPLVDRAVDETRRVLQRAGVGAQQLAGILLVGGSSRIPLVASRLHGRFGVAPTVPEQPELPVAYGGLLAVAEGGPGLAATVGTAPPGPPPVPYPAEPTSPSSPFATAPVTPAPFATAPVTPAPFPGAPTSFPGSPESSVTFSAAPISPPGGFRPPAAPGRPLPVMPVAPVQLPPRRSSPRRRFLGIPRGVLVILIVGLVLAGAGKLVWEGAQWVSGSVREAMSGVEGGGPGGGTSDGTTDGDALVSIGEPVKLSGGGQGAVATDGTTVYYADVGTEKTEITAVPVAGGGGGWRRSVPVEPAELRLTVVGALLVLDGKDSATDGGKDVRAVVDRADGRTLWKRTFEDLVDVAFVGTDAIVEYQAGSLQPATERIDLKTGKVSWSRPGPSGIVSKGERRVRAPLTWPASLPAGPVAPEERFFGSTVAFRESLAVDQASVVELGDDGQGRVLDAATGKPRVSGRVPLDDSEWTVFDGFVVGKASSSASAGRDTVVAYRLDTLEKVWQLPQSAGESVTEVKPCGPHLVCVLVSSSRGARVSALDVTAGGKVVWKDEDAPSSAYWYVVGGRLLYGEHPFDDISEASVRDPATGASARTLGDETVIGASEGHAMVFDVVSARGVTQWRVATIDLATGARNVAPVGGDQIEQARLVGGVLAVVTKDQQVLVFRVPGAAGVPG